MEPVKFVTYQFLNANGDLLGMEENGANVEKHLRTGISVDGSSIGMASVEHSDLRVMPESQTFQTIRIPNYLKGTCTNPNDLYATTLEHHRFLSYLVVDDKTPSKGSSMTKQGEEDTKEDPSYVRVASVPDDMSSLMFKYHPLDPRGILKTMVDKAHDMGFEPCMFSEVEFYIVDAVDGTPADTATYCSLPPEDKSYDFRQELGTICKDLGMSVKRIHHECGPGQNELELNLTPCMKNADDTVTAVWIMKLLAAKRNQKILFSPKPFADQAGNGLHHHILLRSLETDKDVFYGGDDSPQSISKLCRHGIAGLLKYAPDITAVFAASNESFDRLQPGFEAPIRTSWGFSNRTALVRVPQDSNGDRTRFEYRGGDMSGSVHLFGAVLLAAVLKGIELELEPPPPIEFNAEHLSKEELADHEMTEVPLTFDECIKVLKASDFLKNSLGEEMVDFLINRDQALASEHHFV